MTVWQYDNQMRKGAVEKMFSQLVMWLGIIWRMKAIRHRLIARILLGM